MIEPAEFRLHPVEVAMERLDLGRSKIYELFKAGRLRSVKEGRRRMIPETAIREYINLLEREAA